MGIRRRVRVASHNRYEESVLPSGGFGGIVEEAMDCTCALYLNDISAWRLRRLDVSRLRGSHLPVGPTGEMAADTVGQPGNRCPTSRCQNVPPIQLSGTMS